jgi:hypothetical protein
VMEARRRSVAPGEWRGGELLPLDMMWDGEVAIKAGRVGGKGQMARVLKRTNSSRLSGVQMACRAKTSKECRGR